MDDKKTPALLQSYECLNACILNQLTALDQHISCSDIFFNGTPSPMQYISSDTPVVLSNIYQTNFNAMDYWQISYKRNHYTGTSPELFLSAQLLHTECISLRTSTKQLRYHNIFTHCEDSPHYLNVNELSGDNLYCISDGFVPTYTPSTFYGFTSRDSILQAWQDMDYEYVLLNDRYINLNYINVRNETIRHMKTYLKACLENSSTEISEGQTALTRLFHDFNQTFQQSPDKSKLCIDLNYNLRLFGLITSRMYIYDVLHTTDAYLDYADAYKSIIDQWSKLLLSLIRIGVSGSTKKAMLLYDKATTLIETENLLYTQILNC